MKPLWEEPILQEIEAGDVDAAIKYLQTKDEDILPEFERLMTAELHKMGLPIVMIQPGDPGHAEAKSAARKLLKAGWDDDVARHPNHERGWRRRPS